MELPWLKNKQKNQGGGSVIERTAAPTREDGMDKELIEHVADEFMQAMEKKDRKLLMEALTALVLHIQDEDKEQDEGM